MADAPAPLTVNSHLQKYRLRLGVPAPRPRHGVLRKKPPAVSAPAPPRRARLEVAPAEPLEAPQQMVHPQPQLTPAVFSSPFSSLHSHLPSLPLPPGTVYGYGYPPPGAPMLMQQLLNQMMAQPQLQAALESHAAVVQAFGGTVAMTGIPLQAPPPRGLPP